MHKASSLPALMSCPDTLDLDELKFAALDGLAGTVAGGKDEEDHPYRILERFDAVLQRELGHFLREHPLPSFARSRTRALLAHQMDSLENLDLQSDLATTSARDCLELLELVEDPAQSWLLVGLFHADLLSRLYSDLETGDMESLREDFHRLVDRSILLEDEEQSRLYVKVDHGRADELLYLLHRFFAAHLEFAEAVQSAYLKRFPELPQRLWEALKKDLRG